jgi:alkanesulfonate monooxygenase SsuD/methylene tetrahydromethanopterin reductase-like flavin-dependent oxidoreductase (luciferase family)
MLDEGLMILDGLWSGETVTHRGQHYAVEGVSLAPRPLQRPRIPIWIGGEGVPALRRPHYRANRDRRDALSTAC